MGLPKPPGKWRRPIMKLKGGAMGPAGLNDGRRWRFHHGPGGWQWIRTCGDRVAEHSTGFAKFFECMRDAQEHGFDPIYRFEMSLTGGNPGGCACAS
jgi:hypothetical protein